MKNEFKTKKFGKLEVTKIIQHNTSFNALIIPKGFQLLTLFEAIELLNNKKFVKWINFKNERNDFFIQQPFVHNKDCAAWLGCGNLDFLINTFSNLNSNRAARGVVLKKVKP